MSFISRHIAFPLLVAAHLGSATPALATSYPAGYDWRAADPLLYGQLVVEGVIAAVELKTVGKERFGLPENMPDPAVMTLVLEKVNCLRGACVETRIDAKPFIDWRTLVGKRVVLCASTLPRYGDFIVRDLPEVLVFGRGKWERMGPPEAIDDAALRARLASLNPTVIAQRADLVVTGTVVSVSDSLVRNESKRVRGQIRRVSLAVTSRAKGKDSGHVVQFAANLWEARVPDLGVGEQWVAFLERRGDDYWLIAGANGILKVGANDELLYDGVARLRLSWSRLERSIQEH